MARWTKTPTEYEQARKIMLDATGAQPMIVQLKGGEIIKGVVVGTHQGTDVGDNLSAGRGPVVTSMYGEVRLQKDEGQTLLIDALDIEAIGTAPKTQNSN